MESDIELRFKKLRQKYLLKITFGILSWVILQFFLIFLQHGFAWSIFFYFLLIAYVLFCNFQQRLKINNLLLQDIDLSLYRLYLENIKPVKGLNRQYVVIGYKSQLEVIEGDFANAKSILEHGIKAEHLFNVAPITQIIIIRQSLLISIYQSDEELYIQHMARLQTVHCKTAKISQLKDDVIEEINAIHDLVVDNRINSYFETRASNNKLSYLRNLYYKGLNAKLSNKIELAENYFQELSQENDQLFIVRRAKEELTTLAE